jgi:hypothetical protein
MILLQEGAIDDNIWETWPLAYQITRRQTENFGTVATCLLVRPSPHDAFPISGHVNNPDRCGTAFLSTRYRIPFSA